MQRFRLLSLGLGLLAGTASAAEQTDLTYRFSAFQGPPLFTAGQRLRTGATPPTTLRRQPHYRSSKPIYGAVSLGTGEDTTFVLVLDESRGTGRGYDLLYADTNHNRDLTDDRPVRATYRHNTATFGPLPLLIEVDGRKQLYHAMLEGQEGGPVPAYFLKSLGYYVGTARFGAKRYPVALVDFNANGLYGDPFRDFGPDPSKAGDMLLVDTDGDGRFEQAGVIPKETLWCGRRIVVDGRFYQLAIGQDGSALHVTPAPVKLAAIGSDYPRFGLILANDDGVLPIESQNGQARVPVGNYRVLVWSIERRTESGKWEVQGGAWGTEAGAPELTVAEGGSASFKLAAPLRAKVTAARTSPRDIDFQLSLTTASGENIGNVAVDGRQPPEPTLRLLDDQGNEVANLRFHYG
jgi:hypothetical protein